ncbi:S1/P1 Nuclease [Caulobacter sp. S45]|uniref:S1/P1 Nuclease n=1 Tax=Caulobacter sp. S45 TaxID=1641861 RepID=UPI0020C64915|nr:S1/P1 Nuclease [Caulobacter sp. S45]
MTGMGRILILRVAGGLLSSAAALAGPTAALAWGATGHRLIGEAAMQMLPPDLPAFLRSPDAVQAVGEIAREPDRSKGSGQPHDHDLDPGHFLDLDDQGRVNGGPLLSAMPVDREAYDLALQAVATDAYRSGYLPYNIEDGFEQVVKDLAYWRVETAALKSDASTDDRAWIARDLQTRVGLTIRDIGYWAHFVGDASQPLHVSVHHNGWGAYPNPHGYSDDKLHAPFEGAFVHDHLTLASVEAAMRAPRPCAPIADCTLAYLAATGAEVEPLYAMWGAGDFARADPKAVAFATARVAEGAAKLRDMVAAAWRASNSATVGYKPDIGVKAAEAGQPVPIGVFYGSD